MRRAAPLLVLWLSALSPSLGHAQESAPPLVISPPPEKVWHTGSHLSRPGQPPVVPVTVLDREQLLATGLTSLGDILQRLPEQANAINTQFNNGGDGATRVNLRGLGTASTLVLVNGRRHVAGGTGADVTVDLNAIPLAAVERVEILKGGGSAIHGSGAIAGVVNIITRRDFSGTEAQAFSGLSGHGDGLRYDLSLTTGQNTERGSLLFTAGYSTQKSVMAADREFSRYTNSYEWETRRSYVVGSTAGPSSAIFLTGDAQVPGNRAWEALWARYRGAPLIRDPDRGEWQPFNFSLTEAGGDLYNYRLEDYLITPQQRAHAHAAGSLRLSVNTDAFFEASYVNRQSAQQLSAQTLLTLDEGVTFDARNVYNPFGRPFRDVRRRLSEFGSRHFTQDLTTFRVVTGLEGGFTSDFGPLDGFTWELASNFGRTQGIDTRQGLVQRSRLAAALGPSFIDPVSGQPTCGTPAAPIADCVPLNLLGGPGDIDSRAVESLSYRGTARGFSQQTTLSAKLAGSLFRVTSNAHAAGIALGYEHRREAGAYIPDPLAAKGDTTGNKESPAEGRYYVNEAYAELSIPVVGTKNEETGELRDMLELLGAARVARYSTTGTKASYQLGSRLSVIPDVTVRTTYSSGFRAPGISELYQGPLEAFPAATDPCSDREQGTPVDAVCDAQGVPDELFDGRTQQRALWSGNAALKPETAKSFTVGLVFEPRFLPAASATVDYYAISVDNSINRVGEGTILNSCYPSQPDVAPQLCERITRDENGLISLINDPLDNRGGYKTGGLDLALRYQPWTSFGQLGFSVDATWLQRFDQTLEGQTVAQAKNTYDLGGVYSDWRANAGVSWARNGLRSSANVRFISGFTECENNFCSQLSAEPAPRSRQVKDYATLDVSVAYDWRTKPGTATAQFGVNNLFDANPAQVVNGFLTNSDAATYDYMGRYFYLRLSYHYE
jgi:iron complex outermembrane receptor protein